MMRLSPYLLETRFAFEALIRHAEDPEENRFAYHESKNEDILNVQTKSWQDIKAIGIQKLLSSSLNCSINL